MAQPVLDRLAVPAIRPASSVVSDTAPTTPDLYLRDPLLPGIQHRPVGSADLLRAAARADVIRLAFSAAVPGVIELISVITLAEEAVAAAGRQRQEVRLLLDLDVVLAADEDIARRKRAELEYLDALSGLTWSPADTRVVTTAPRLLDDVRELADRTGVDGVVLYPLSGGARVEAELRDLISRGAGGR